MGKGGKSVQAELVRGSCCGPRGGGGFSCFEIPLWAHGALSEMSLRGAGKPEYLLTKSCLSLVEGCSWGLTAWPYGPALRGKQGSAVLTCPWREMQLIEQETLVWKGAAHCSCSQLPGRGRKARREPLLNICIGLDLKGLLFILLGILVTL